jgi:hypothetical protein
LAGVTPKYTLFLSLKELFILTCELFFEKLLLNRYGTFSDFYSSFGLEYAYYNALRNTNFEEPSSRKWEFEGLPQQKSVYFPFCDVGRPKTFEVLLLIKSYATFLLASLKLLAEPSDNVSQPELGILVLRKSSCSMEKLL